jgi:hypothetical protein
MGGISIRTSVPEDINALLDSMAHTYGLKKSAVIQMCIVMTLTSSEMMDKMTDRSRNIAERLKIRDEVDMKRNFLRLSHLKGEVIRQVSKIAYLDYMTFGDIKIHKMESIIKTYLNIFDSFPDSVRQTFIDDRKWIEELSKIERLTELMERKARLLNDTRR